MKHLVIFSDTRIGQLLNGELKADFRFLKKKSDVLGKIHSGDLVFFRKARGEVLGQFEIGKLVIVEKLKKGDWGFLKKLDEELGFSLKPREFEEIEVADMTFLISQITKVEQFITPPIEIDKKGKKEWVVLD